MSKPVLLSGGNGKVLELAGTNNNDVLTWDSGSDGGSWTAASGPSGVYLPLTGGTLTGKLTTPASTTTTAGLNLPHGTAPTSPVNGDVWTTTTGGLFVQINSLSRQVGTLATAQTWLGNNTFTSTAIFSAVSNSFGTSTLTGTTGLSTGATTNGSIKTVNIGTAGLVGSTTTITIGATAGTSTTTLNGTVTFVNGPSLPTGTTGVTQSAGNNTTALATTAFVTTAVAASAGTPYDLPFEIPGTPATSTKVVNFKAVRAFALAATGHQGGQLTAPSANFVCTVAKNGTSIGTITFAAGGFSSSVTATSFVTSDVLSVETPAAALGIDTPFATLAMTLA